VPGLDIVLFGTHKDFFSLYRTFLERIRLLRLSGPGGADLHFLLAARNAFNALHTCSIAQRCAAHHTLSYNVQIFRTNHSRSVLRGALWTCSWHGAGLRGRSRLGLRTPKVQHLFLWQTAFLCARWVGPIVVSRVTSSVTSRGTLCVFLPSNQAHFSRYL